MIKNISLKNKIIEYIYEAILNNEYKQNEQIKENFIAIKLEVSRAPIREALSELVSLGILEQVQNRGVFLKNISSSDILNTYESKGLIEGFLARSFASYANEKDISVLEEYLYLMCSKDNNAKEVAELGKKFHKYYLKYAKNTVLLDVLEKLNKKSLLLFSQNWSKLYTLEEIKNRHKKILDVLKSLDKENIENTIKDHYFETGSKIVLLR